MLYEASDYYFKRMVTYHSYHTFGIIIKDTLLYCKAKSISITKEKMNQVSRGGFRMRLNLGMLFPNYHQRKNIPFTFSFLKKMKQIQSYVIDSKDVSHCRS